MSTTEAERQKSRPSQLTRARTLRGRVARAAATNLWRAFASLSIGSDQSAARATRASRRAPPPASGPAHLPSHLDVLQLEDDAPPINERCRVQLWYARTLASVRMRASAGDASDKPGLREEQGLASPARLRRLRGSGSMEAMV